MNDNDFKAFANATAAMTTEDLNRFLITKELEAQKLEITTENIIAVTPDVEKKMFVYKRTGVLVKLQALVALVIKFNYNITLENLLSHVLENRPVTRDELVKMHEENNEI